MRRGILLAAVVTMLFATTACSTLGLGGSGTERVERSGTLRVGMAGDYPPMNARTRDGSLIGLDADLAASLAAILEVELVMVERPIGELLDAVRSGDVDIAISGLTMIPRRNLDVAFAGPYYVARKAMLAKAETLDGVENLSDLRGRGLKVTAVAGGTSEALVRRVLPNAKHQFVEDQTVAITHVIDGRADVLIADDPVARFALLKYPTRGLGMVLVENSAEPIGIAIAPDDHLFVNLVENYLGTLDEIGLLDQMRERWFSKDDWIKRVE